MPVSPADFAFVQTLVRRSAAIVLDKGKEYLVESRLEPLAREEGFQTLGHMIDSLRNKPVNGMHHKIVEAMTTNETSFFRDLHPFEALRKTVLPAMAASRASTKSLKIWCGAASTGQEPYSIAMVMHENFAHLAGWNLQILATDISNEVLQRARSGRFRQMEVNRGLPAPLLVKHFRERSTMWEINENLRRMVQFREMNLATTWPTMPVFDIIFLRNVMIYFDLETKRAILAKIRKQLAPDGYLFLGGAETTFSVDDNFERVVFNNATCYKIKPTAAPPALPTRT